MSPNEAATCAITKMLHALDLRDWQKVRDAFADHVDVDYSSLSGEPAANVAGDDLVGGWRSFVGAFDATQHMTGPCTATERDHEVVVHTHVRGYHRIADAPGGATWLVAGHYVLRLVQRRAGWRIVGLTLKVLYQEGNLELPAIARSRAATPVPLPASPA
jgi:hypothetical protein